MTARLKKPIKGAVNSSAGLAKKRNPVPPLRSKLAAKKRTKRAPNPAHSAATVKAAKLYQEFTGHDPEIYGKVKLTLPKSAARIGTCDGILYTTVRDGVTEKYIHKFRASDKPDFCVGPDGQILLVGGAYDFTERGIVDHSDTKNR